MSNRLRDLREAKTLTKTALAQAVGVSRQALHALEAGTSVPGVDVALRLAAVLGVTVEALFSGAADEARIVARLVTPLPAKAGRGRRETPGEGRPTRKWPLTPTLSPLAQGEGATTRVALAKLHDEWVAHPLSPRSAHAADGLYASGTVEPLGTLDRARRRLLVMGCAPALGLLASRLGDEVPLTWLPGGSRTALEALARGDVHIAGIHHGSETTRTSLIKTALPRTPSLRVTLADWELGLAVARGNPRHLRDARDLAKPGVRVALREPGSGARSFLEAALAKAHVAFSRLKQAGPDALGHLEVAERISLGVADAGVTIGAAAHAFDLDFIPLVEERFELVIPRAFARDERVERLVDVLSSGPFRRELSNLGGYFTSPTGSAR